MQTYTHDELVAHLRSILALADGEFNARHEMIISAAGALPEGEYILLDSEDDDFPDWPTALGGPRIAFTPSAYTSQDDFALRQVHTRFGVGLLVSWCTELYALPAQLIGWMQSAEETRA